MHPNLRFGMAVMATACALAAPAIQAAEESMGSGPVRLVRNIATGSTNQVAVIASNAGARNCAPRIDLVANFLSRGTQASALLFLPESSPDNSMISVSMEVKAVDLPRAYASATFSPNTAIGCAAEYETVQYWSEPCTAVAAKTFKGATPSGSLGGEISILTIGPAARVFLMRTTATSCVSIKKEVLK
jgi:hypothetical protein